MAFQFNSFKLRGNWGLPKGIIDRSIGAVIAGGHRLPDSASFAENERVRVRTNTFHRKRNRCSGGEAALYSKIPVHQSSAFDVDFKGTPSSDAEARESVPNYAKKKNRLIFFKVLS